MGGHLYTFQGFLRSRYRIEIFLGVAKFQIFFGVPDIFFFGGGGGKQ